LVRIRETAPSNPRLEWTAVSAELSHRG